MRLKQLSQRPDGLRGQSNQKSFNSTIQMVVGAGFEPAYSERTDLQSVAFNHSATPPKRKV